MRGRDRLTRVCARARLQSAAVLATEIKNNANKLFRWTIESLLAGVDLLKLGCAARGWR